ncbi:RND family transporter [Mycobacterium seoulense]|uniref:Membrane protein n=1 Tax=Mycobacterium seoulense TaxID=386911 RepID=A0A7I7P113_9MYCO|nr:MMPL family transporter [Mycobacterium seoulense]MCV7437536.1 MMPL family transporter [Mycobacterium seoulense]BBY02556.1 membrane protein [Mycobacterium seoulense]
MSAPVSEAVTEELRVPVHPRAHFGGIALVMRKLSVPIIVAWIGLAVFLNVSTPQLEKVGELRSVSMSPKGAPAAVAMQRIGRVFEEYSSDSSAMIVLEGKDRLGPQAREYYGKLVAALRADTAHVEHVQDFWSDPLTASGVQSGDGKAAYAQINLVGNQGEAKANDSVAAVHKIIDQIPAPPGVKAYLTGGAALAAEQQAIGHSSMKSVEKLTMVVIVVMLLAFFRSIITTLLIMATLGISVATVRGTIAFLGYHNIIGLSTFATSLVVTLAIAIAVDYAVFLIGRYQEARSLGQDRESAYYTMFGTTAHVIVGSGLTIAGATFCLSFTRLPYFQTLGVPLAIGMLVMVAFAMTFGAALVVVASKFGLLDPKRALRSRGWRKIGAAVVRWPGPILAASLAISLIGLIALPSYKTSYDDRKFLPASIPSSQGYAAAERHFAPARLNPEMLMIETDHDLRNPANFLVINKIAKAVFKVPGIGRVQTITRPDGQPIDHSTIPYALSQQSMLSKLNEQYQGDRTADMLKQAAVMQTNIDTMEKMQGITVQMAETTSNMVTKMKDMSVTLAQVRDQLANFDDFFRPLRSYLYWERHCYDIPVCWALRSMFDALDGIDSMTDSIQDLIPDMERLNSLMPQMVALMPAMINAMKSVKQMMLTMYQTQKGMQQQTAEMQQNSQAMGEAFDAAKNDDSFYLPPEAFDNADFKRGIKQFVSPNGNAVRFIIAHEGDPMSPEGIEKIDAIKQAAKEALKGTPLEGARIYLGGTASTFKDMADGTKYDLMIAGIAALALIFLIMLIITRAIIAAAVIVGAVVMSLCASFGISVLLWEHIIGLELHWMVLPMAMIIQLAVGADYNLLVISRLKEEVTAGVRTGIIRTLGGSGPVVTAAAMLFAFTMMTMAVGELRVIGQVGTTIGLGLIFDTVIVRSFMTPAIATLLGRWYWWPQRVRVRPLPAPWPKVERLHTDSAFGVTP